MMKLKQPFKVGQRIFNTQTGHRCTVTAHTRRGFRYSFDEDYPFIPRWGMYYKKGSEGECYLPDGAAGWEKWNGKNKVKPMTVHCYNAANGQFVPTGG